MKPALAAATTGSLAGILCQKVFVATADALYARTSEEVRARERLVEPRDPFVVLAQKIAAAAHRPIGPRGELRFEKGAVLATCAAAGAAYGLMRYDGGRPSVVRAAVFGTLFWLVADEGLSSMLGLVGDNSKYPLKSHARGFATHMAFGLATAAVFEPLFRLLGKRLVSSGQTAPAREARKLLSPRLPANVSRYVSGQMRDEPSRVRESGAFEARPRRSFGSALSFARPRVGANVSRSM